MANLVPSDKVDIDEKEDGMYTFEDKGEGDVEGMTVVVEESGGGVGLGAGVKASSAPDGADVDGRLKDQEGVSEPEGEEYGEVDGEGEEVELSEKGDSEYAWDEGYQQEV